MRRFCGDDCVAILESEFSTFFSQTLLCVKGKFSAYRCLWPRQSFPTGRPLPCDFRLSENVPTSPNSLGQYYPAKVSYSTSVDPFYTSATLGEVTHFQRHKCPRPDAECACWHGRDREEKLEMPIKQKERSWLKAGFCSKTDNHKLLSCQTQFLEAQSQKSCRA